MTKKIISSRYVTLLLVALPLFACSQNNDSSIDEKAEAFLKKQRTEWDSWNIPYEDGQVLYDIIVDNGYTSGLEIGTSTGHSTIWIAWAMSKTGGKVTTIEIDEGRHNEALENIRKAGLEEYVDARLGDAHELVKILKGPFDFVFSDADKGWYTQYFKDVDPKLEVGGCFTAHNVSNNFGGARDFVEYVQSLDNYETTINRASRSGISVSYKRSE